MISGLLVTHRIESYQVAEVTLFELVTRSTIVAHVKIIGAQELRLEVSEGSVSCGYNYSAYVIEELKGHGTQVVEFRSAGGLMPGSEYLIFASSQDLDSMRRFQSMGESKKESYEKCSTAEPGLFVSTWHSEVLEFGPIGEGIDQVQWLIAHAKNLNVGDNVKKIEINYSSEDLSLIFAELYSFVAYSWLDIRREINACCLD